MRFAAKLEQLRALGWMQFPMVIGGVVPVVKLEGTQPDPAWPIAFHRRVPGNIDM